jgi:hypothetical protein
MTAAVALVGSGFLGAPPAGAVATSAGGVIGGPQFRVRSFAGSSTETAGPASAGLTTWQGSFSYGGAAYTYQMIGTNPAAGSATTTVPAAIVPLRFVVGGHMVDGSGPSHKLATSPLFAPARFSSGTTQFGDAMRRADFWPAVSGTSPGYHVLLGRPSILGAPIVNVPASEGSYHQQGQGQPYVMVSYEWFAGQVVGLLQAHKLPASTLVVLLAGNVFLYENGNEADCCVYGFHGSYPASRGKATYAYANYLSSVVPAPFTNIYAASHEVAEWLDDPFVTNVVPRWVQPGSNVCFGDLLEVADPVEALARPSYAVQGKGGTWHPTDVAGISWFSHESPSSEQDGKYSYHGFLTTPSNLC